VSIVTTRVLSQVPTAANFYFKWILANALAELAGLGAVALLIVLLMLRLETGITFGLASLLFAAVLFEGLCVGVAQWWVLREWLELTKAWIGMTMLGGAVAWLIGMLAGTFFGSQNEMTPVSEPSSVMMLTLAAVMGLAVGALLGIAQWFVLRRYVKRAAWWILANALAWSVGMAIIFTAIDFLALTPSFVLAVVALLLTGDVVGAIHGSMLVWLLRQSVIKVSS
jgi:hypothetical protein